jgi:signal recognition particle receptor subunit beta
MVFFNWATMQMAAKIVYYGPGLCGKTTNLSYIYAKTAPGSRGEMVSLETETDRTLFFDLLPLEVGKVGGFRTRLQLYTVPGQVFYNTTRKLVLKGVDGVVFVADSQRPMAEANVESFKNLEENLRELGLDTASLPLVLQYNKRDLKNVLSLDELNLVLNPRGQWECHESVAVQGSGVFETLKAITKITLKSLRRRMAAQEGAPAAVAQPVPGVRAGVTFNPAALSAAAAEGLGPAVPAAVVSAAVPAAASRPIAAAQVTPVFSAAAVAPAADAAFVPAPAEPLAPPPETTGQPFGSIGEHELPDAAEITQEAVELVSDEAPPAEGEASRGEPVPIAQPAAETRSEAAQPAKEAEETAAEESEEAPVEFATTTEPEAPVAVQAEVRHVKVSSSLDILAELENLRKAATSRPTPLTPARQASGLDLDALLQSSLNSRMEVRRRVDEQVGQALQRARLCTVRIELVGTDGSIVSSLAPVEVEIKRHERIRQLALTLNVHLQGE